MNPPRKFAEEQWDRWISMIAKTPSKAANMHNEFSVVASPQLSNQTFREKIWMMDDTRLELLRTVLAMGVGESFARLCEHVEDKRMGQHKHSR